MMRKEWHLIPKHSQSILLKMGLLATASRQSSELKASVLLASCLKRCPYITPPQTDLPFSSALQLPRRICIPSDQENIFVNC